MYPDHPWSGISRKKRDSDVSRPSLVWDFKKESEILMYPDHPWSGISRKNGDFDVSRPSLVWDSKKESEILMYPDHPWSGIYGGREMEELNDFRFKVFEKAVDSCNLANINALDHFADVGNMVRR